jgi:hypothetical protein
MKQKDSIAVEGVSPMAYRHPVGTHVEDRPTPLVLPPKTSLQVFRQFMQRMEDMDPSKAHDVSGNLPND